MSQSNWRLIVARAKKICLYGGFSSIVRQKILTLSIPPRHELMTMTKSNLELAYCNNFLLWPWRVLVKVTSHHMNIISQCFQVIITVFSTEIAWNCMRMILVLYLLLSNCNPREQCLPVHKICWMRPGTKSFLKLAGSVADLYGICKSPRTNTSIFFRKYSPWNDLFLKFNFQVSQDVFVLTFDLGRVVTRTVACDCAERQSRSLWHLVSYWFSLKWPTFSKKQPHHENIKR